MAPLLALGIKALLPVLVNEAAKKIAGDDSTPYQSPKEVPLIEAAPVAVKAAVVGTVKSKTMWFSIVLGILGVVEAHGPFLVETFGTNMGWILVVVGGATAVLRTITTNSMVDKTS